MEEGSVPSVRACLRGCVSPIAPFQERTMMCAFCCLSAGLSPQLPWAICDGGIRKRLWDSMGTVCLASTMLTTLTMLIP